MLARAPWMPPKAQAKPRQLNRDRRKHLVETVARAMRTARNDGHQPTLLNLEAPMRHGLRSMLCLKGWAWREADTVAAGIVADALRRVGAVRPSWDEAQPEFVQNGSGALIERTRCINCHTPLSGEQTKFCCLNCASSFNARLRRRNAALDAAAYDYASRL